MSDIDNFERGLTRVKHVTYLHTMRKLLDLMLGLTEQQRLLQVISQERNENIRSLLTQIYVELEAVEEDR